MTLDDDTSETKTGFTRRSVFATLAVAAFVVPTLQDATDAQGIGQSPSNVFPTPNKLLFPSKQQIARTAHTATLLPNGLLLVVGGTQFTEAPLSGVQIFNPFLNEWHDAASLQTSRSDHAASLLPDGRVLICGGLHAGGRAMAGSEIYDPQTNAWSESAPLNMARYGHAATPFANGTVLVIGGTGSKPIAGCEFYDPEQDVWEILDSSSHRNGERG